MKKVHELIFVTNFSALVKLWNDAMFDLFPKNSGGITTMLSHKIMKDILLKVLHARVQVFVKSYR
jgi:hypothetical protein